MIRRRAPLKRSTKPLKRTAIARSTKPVRKRRPGPPRRGPAGVPADEWRNPEHLQFLRDEGKCYACIVEFKRRHSVLTVDGVRDAIAIVAGACEPMHGPPNGRSQKGPDAGAIPGCRPHHEEQTRIGWAAFEAKYGFSREVEARVWWGAFVILRSA
jgi:hypothetical protein